MSLQIGSPPKRFQSTWDTTQTDVGAASDRQVSLPLESAGTYNFQVDWGDGKSNRDTITAYNQAEVTHTYDNTGIYEIRIIGGITGIYINSNSESKKIKEISLWGPFHLRTGYRVFRGCENLVLKTTDTLNLSHGPSMRQCFDGCYVLGSDGNIGSWDVSNVTRVRSWFSNCRTFNEDLSNWDVSSLGSISDEGNGLFGSCYIFNNGGSPGISGWDVSNWTNSAGMDSMFNRCYAFNQPIGTWDVSNVKKMNSMFLYASAFNQDLSNWDMSSVTDMGAMFYLAADFNNAGSTGINNWNTSSNTRLNSIFRQASSFNQPIGNWDTSKVTLMSEVFSQCPNFNQDISNWDVTGVTSMASMFSSATNFNNGGSTGINNWRPSSCTNMSSMFPFSDFNQPINDWDVSKVTSMSSMFRGTPFNQPLSGWDVGAVTNMHNMFNYNSPFNQDIGSWNVTGVVGTPGSNNGFRGTFASNSQFNNGDSPSISGWDVSNCRNMVAMFQSNSYFNQPIGAWDLSAGPSIYNMFDGATSFNNGGSSDISGWDVSNITSFQGLFKKTPFNQSIGYWDTSSVGGINETFREADAFDQDLSNWNVASVTNATNFMYNASGLSTTNYDRTLSGWSSQSVQNGVNIHFGSSNYSTATGAAYRATLVSKGWTITDGGAV